jgi:hypothetical protein
VTTVAPIRWAGGPLAQRPASPSDDRPTASAPAASVVAPYASAYERDYISLTRSLVWWTRGTVIVGIIGIVGLAVSLIVVAYQLRQNSYITASEWTFDIDKVFIEHPDLRPYFYEGKNIEQKEPDAKRYMVTSTAELILDSMDSMLDTHNDSWPDEGWRTRAEDVFRQSPVLRSRLEERRTWYCRRLYLKYLDWSKESR